MSASSPRTRSREREARNAPARPRRSLAGAFRRHQDVAVDSLARLFGEAGASLLTALVIGIALALPLCLFLLLQNIQQIGASFGDAGGRFSLFMEAGLESAELEDVRAGLLDRPDVAGVELISAEQALEEFRATSGFAEVLDGLEENPLPAVLVLSPRESAGIEVLAAALRDWPGVDDVQLDMQWVQRLQGIIELARRLTVGLAALLCLGVVLVIGNTVRLTIENRRAEIVVVKLVGGTDAYVARPFLYAGLWYGVGGGIVAWLLVQAGLWGLQGPAARLAGLYGDTFRLAGVDSSGVLLIVLGGGLLGWLGAWVSVIRHLKRIEPR